MAAKRRKSTLEKYDQAFAMMSKDEQRDLLSILYRFLFRGDTQTSGKVGTLRNKKFQK
jgi:hypothetical protein